MNGQTTVVRATFFRAPCPRTSLTPAERLCATPRYYTSRTYIVSGILYTVRRVFSFHGLPERSNPARYIIISCNVDVVYTHTHIRPQTIGNKKKPKIFIGYARKTNRTNVLETRARATGGKYSCVRGVRPCVRSCNTLKRK